MNENCSVNSFEYARLRMYPDNISKIKSDYLQFLYGIIDKANEEIYEFTVGGGYLKVCINTITNYIADRNQTIIDTMRVIQDLLNY